jgi:hypothetical protein
MATETLATTRDRAAAACDALAQLAWAEARCSPDTAACSIWRSRRALTRRIRAT